MVHTRKRPPDERECVVKCCLKRGLHLPGVIPLIEKYVLNSSRLFHHGTLLVNHYVCDMFRRGVDIEDFKCLSDQMFFYNAFCIVAKPVRRTKYPDLLRFYNEKSALYPDDIHRITSDGPILNAAAKQITTNVGTYLKVNFERRLFNVIKASMSIDVGKGTINALKWLVMGMPRYTAYRVLNQEQTVLVRRLRTLIAGNDVADDVEIDNKWMRTNPERILYFFWWILERIRLDGLNVKSFNLLPVMSQKRHFIAISADVLKQLLLFARVVPDKIDDEAFNALIDEHRKSTFRTPRQSKLGNTIETDGVSVCFHVIKKTAANPTNKSTKKKSDYPSKPVNVMIDNVVAVDPGRCNIASTVQKNPDGSWKKCRLTRTQFYRDSHVTVNKEKMERLDKRFISTEMAGLSECISKTSDVPMFENYLATKKNFDKRLWKHRFERCFGLMAMDNYIHKKKTVDKFWQHTVGLKSDMVVAYGDAGFSSNGRGEMSVPTCKMKGAAGRFSPLFMVDENRTSKTCCECGEDLRGIKVPGSPKPLRAVRRCGSNDCREAPLKSRDWSAAINIFWRFTDPSRVPWLFGAA